MKAQRKAAIALGALALVAGALILATPSLIEAGLARALLAKKQRTIAIDSLSFSLRPSLSVEARGLTLSERGTKEEFAAAGRVRVALDAASLLTPPLKVSSVEVDGLHAAVVRRKDGTLNIADLLASEEPAGAPLQIEVADAHVADARITWRDETSGNASAMDVDLSCAGLRADTGKGTLDVDRLALGAAGKAGAATVKVKLETPLAVDPARQTLSLERLAGTVEVADASLPARRIGLPFAGSLRMDLAKQSLQGRLSGSLDDSKLALRFDAASLSPLALGFALDVDRLDVDRYLPGNGSREGASSGLSLPQDIRLDGTAHVGNLVFGSMRAANIRFRVKSANGRIAIAPLAAGGKAR